MTVSALLFGDFGGSIFRSSFFERLAKRFVLVRGRADVSTYTVEEGKERRRRSGGAQHVVKQRLKLQRSFYLTTARGFFFCQRTLMQ